MSVPIVNTKISDTNIINSTIIDFLNLEDRWDGYTAPVFKQSHIERALQLVRDIHDYCTRMYIDYTKIQPFVAPCSNGDILFDMTGIRFPIRELEIYIPSSIVKDLEFLMIDNTTHDLHIEGSICSEYTLNYLLDWLLEPLSLV